MDKRFPFLIDSQKGEFLSLAARVSGPGESFACRKGGIFSCKREAYDKKGRQNCQPFSLRLHAHLENLDDVLFVEGDESDARAGDGFFRHGFKVALIRDA